MAISVALSFLEEYRAQKELEALDRLLAFKATVLRDGARARLTRPRLCLATFWCSRMGRKFLLMRV